MFNYIASAGDANNPGTMFRLLNTSGGAQERFFDGGAYRVPEAMANTLADNIVYSAPVSKIDTRTGKAVVTTVGRHLHRQAGHRRDEPGDRRPDQLPRAG